MLLGTRLTLCGVAKLGVVVYSARCCATKVEGVGAGRRFEIPGLPWNFILSVGWESVFLRRSSRWVGLGREFWSGIVSDLDSWLVLLRCQCFCRSLSSGHGERTPLVVRGSERGTLLENSPCLSRASAFREADIVICCFEV